MTALFIYIKHHCPRLWKSVERVNGWLFLLRYGSAEKAASAYLGTLAQGDIRLSLVGESDIAPLSRLLNDQPEEYMRYFHPHDFSEKELRRLLANPAFLMTKATRAEDGEIVGYSFLRCFFSGRAFRGCLVGRGYDGKGIGAAMMKCNAAICSRMRLRLFSTVSSENIASLKASRKAAAIRNTSKLNDGYMLMEWETGTK